MTLVNSSRLVPDGEASGNEGPEQLFDADTSYSTVPSLQDAGTYRVGYNVQGDGNHTAGDAVQVSATIQPRQVSLSWSETVFTYDKKSHLPTAAVNGLVGGDTCGVTVTGAQTNAGTYTATATAWSNPNYQLTGAATQQFTIRKANPTVTAAASILKGKTTTVKVTGGGKVTFKTSSKKIATVSNRGVVTGFAQGKVTITVTVAANGNYNKLTKKLTIYVSPKATTLSTVTNSKAKTMTVTWRQQAEVTGYQVQYSTDKTFKTGKIVPVSGARNLSKVIGKLAKGKTYFVRVRTYYGTTKNVSAWSKAKSVKISK